MMMTLGEVTNHTEDIVRLVTWVHGELVHVVRVIVGQTTILTMRAPTAVMIYMVLIITVIAVFGPTLKVFVTLQPSTNVT